MRIYCATVPLIPVNSDIVSSNSAANHSTLCHTKACIDVCFNDWLSIETVCIRCDRGTSQCCGTRPCVTVSVSYLHPAIGAMVQSQRHMLNN